MNPTITPKGSSLRMRKRTVKHTVPARAAVWILALFLLLPVLYLPVTPVSAAAKLTETVNLSRPQKNMSGSGYYWDNRKDTLTLDGLYIDTTDDYGLRIPDGATVILKGKNYITASKAALTCAGSVNFKGSGSLILTSGDMGIYFYSTDDSTVARFLEGTYEITAAGDGIHSEYTSLSFVDGKMNISSASADSFAINGRTVKLYGGSVTADNSIHAALTLDIQALSLRVESGKAALSAGKTLSLNKVAVTAGSAASSMKQTEQYGGENCVSLKSTANTLGTSVLFGENVPKFVDILVILLLALLIAAGIAAPFLRSRQKAKKALAAAAAAEAAQTPRKDAPGTNKP